MAVIFIHVFAFSLASLWEKFHHGRIFCHFAKTSIYFEAQSFPISDRNKWRKFLWDCICGGWSTDGSSVYYFSFIGIFAYSLCFVFFRNKYYHVLKILDSLIHSRNIIFLYSCSTWIYDAEKHRDNALCQSASNKISIVWFFYLDQQKVPV